MESSAIVAFLHHLLAFSMFGLVLTNHLLFKREMTLAEARKVKRLDKIYWFSVIGLVAIGVLRVGWMEKGTQFYMKNSYFHAKVGLFMLAIIISFIPTLKFTKWEPTLKEGKAPEISAAQSKLILMCFRAEMLLLVVAMYCAACMARGLGVIQ